MKKNLFLLVVGLLSSVMSFAQPEGWVAPVEGELTKVSAAVEGVEYYLYNVDADAWFAGGNDWWTAAVVYKTGDKNLSAEGMEHGFKFKLTDKQNDGSYHIYHFYGPNGKFADVNNKWYYLYDRNDGVFFTDNGGGDTFWTFIPDNNGNFMIKSSKEAFGNNPVGLNEFTTDDGATSRSSGSKTGGATMTNKAGVANTTWALYAYYDPAAVAEYEAATALMTRMQEIYEESQEKFDVAPYASQIGNQLGTLENAERLNALLSQLNEDYMAWKIANATPESPVDVTEVYIVNPDFETGNTNGWTYKTSNDHGAKSTTNNTYKMTGSSGAYLFNIWSAGNEISQTSKPLPVGVYKLTAVMATDAGHDLVLTAGEKSASKPSVEKGTGVLVELPFFIEEENEGIKIAAVTADNCWYKVDNFKLYYTGNSADSYAATFIVNYEGKASPQYVKGLADKVAAIRVAEGDEAIKAAYNEAKEYEDSVVAKNIAAWEKYEALLVDAQTLAEDPQFADYSATLAGMVQQRYVMENDPTTAELNAEYDAVVAEMNNVKSHIQPGTDITDTYLKNADFTQNIVGINTGDPTKGWRIDGTKGGGNWLINTGAKCGECWNGNEFDFYQIVENAPVGVYQIDVQGFTRSKRGNDAWNCYFDSTTGELLDKPIFGDWTPNKANVYLNDNTGDLDIVFSKGHPVDSAFFDSGYYTDPLNKYQYPNDLHSAGLCYAAGEYKVSAFGLVAKQGDTMRIGVKGNNYGLDNWMCFTNFKLTYQGFQADIIEPEFNKAVNALATAHIGTELQAEMLDLKERADAVSHSSGKAMFDILSEIYAFNTKKASSEEVFEDLNKQTKDLEDAIQQYKETATEEALKAARKLQATASDAYEDEETLLPTVTTDEAKAIISQITKAIEALKIPKEAGSDDDPVDFTSVIKNANMSSATGWTVEEGSMSIDDSKVAEFYNQENYNVYQKLTNLPAGVYELKVQGFYRAGSVAKDWTALVDSVPSAAVLYTINQSEGYDPEVFECPLRHITAEAVNEDPGFGNMVTFTPFAELGDETKWYVPNMRSSVSQFFDVDYYVNSIYFAVYSPADTTTIGIKKHGPVNDTDWCPFDNWTLTGYGFESAKWEYLGAQTKSCDPVAPEFDPSAAIIKGDANGDREVNITDVSYVLDDINGVENEGFNKEAADVNGDGEINITDVSLILDIINGVDPNAEPEN